MRKREYCGNCVFWQRGASDDASQSPHAIGGTGTTGACVYRAPSPTVHGYGIFPVTAWDRWCADWDLADIDPKDGDRAPLQPVDSAKVVSMMSDEIADRIVLRQGKLS